MALTKEDLQAIQALLEAERQHTSQMIDEKLTQSEKRIISRMEISDKFLERCVNEAAKDTQLTIKQHEKEWHSA